MIQRIQSVYLLLTILLSLLFLPGSFLTFIDNSASSITIGFIGIHREVGLNNSELVERLIPISFLFILIPALALVTIVLFKNRNIQLILSGILIFLIILLFIASTYYSYIIISHYEAHISIGYKMFIPLMLLIFSILAFRAIRNDDRLVKSYDRLR